MHQRRALLRRGAVLGVALLAGCIGDRRPNSEVLSARLDGVGAGEDDQLVVDVLVTNESGETREAVLYVYARVKGRSTRRVEEIQLAAGATETFAVAFDDIRYETFTSDGSVTFDLD